MRALVSRGLIVPSLVCAALLLGPVGTAAAVGDAGAQAPGVRAAEAAARAVAGADTLLDSLRDETHAGRLDPAAASAYAGEVRAWEAAVEERLRSSDTDRAAAPGAADPVADLLATVQSAVQDLLASLTSLDLGGVLGAVTDLLGSVTGAVTDLLGSGLPDLPAVPSLPEAPSVPALPSLPSLPVPTG
ncbi:hypothetical protein ACIPSE_22175 [Streptomyces sp. NPDC090106]|uniref:hypothetical protein n=1 Tax=Streptomyces sp. NPDC090106 TaxID=3365946 RepID=UPI003813F954